MALTNGQVCRPLHPQTQIGNRTRAPGVAKLINPRSNEYYAKRGAAEAGRPRAHTKTQEQVALLEYAFAMTFGFPYTGEVLPLAFLSGL